MTSVISFGKALKRTAAVISPDSAPEVPLKITKRGTPHILDVDLSLIKVGVVYRTSLGASENMGQTTAIGNAKTIRPPLTLRGALAELHATEATSNHARFLSMRKAGKAYWTAGGGTRFWLTEEGVAERRAEGKTMVPVTIDYEEEGQASGTAWKKASVADIECMLSMGKCILLHNC